MWRKIRTPWVLKSSCLSDDLGGFLGQVNYRGDIHFQMVPCIGTQIPDSQLQESACRGKTATMLGMIGMEVLQAEMNKASCQLDQPLVKGMVGMLLSLTQPEILQHIMGLVVATRVEAFKITSETGILTALRLGIESLHELRDPF